jgi:hypothetical protein
MALPFQACGSTIQPNAVEVAISWKFGPIDEGIDRLATHLPQTTFVSSLQPARNLLRGPPLREAVDAFFSRRCAVDAEKRLATHESGHTIAAINFGIPIIRATIEDGHPRVHRGRYQAPDRNLGSELLAVMCLAGPAAEALFCGPITDGRIRSIGR